MLLHPRTSPAAILATAGLLLKDLYKDKRPPQATRRSSAGTLLFQENYPLNRMVCESIPAYLRTGGEILCPTFIRPALWLLYID
jgi:hypothetical protein